ncbi:MAG: IS200/IS605 family transposase [Acidimicrobiales bacterium]
MTLGGLTLRARSLVRASTNKAVYAATHQPIWCPSYRTRLLVGRGEACVKRVIVDVVGEVGGVVIEMEAVPDHGRLVVEVPPAVGLSRLVHLKGLSCRRLRRGFPRHGPMRCLWSPSWFLSSDRGHQAPSPHQPTAQNQSQREPPGAPHECHPGTPRLPAVGGSQQGESRGRDR